MTLDLARKDIPSVCVIKGRVEREIIDIITKHDQISLKFIRRSIFKVYIVIMFLKNFFLQNTICMVLDNYKNYLWISALNKFLGIKTVLLKQEGHIYSLSLNGEAKDINFILTLAEKKR